MLLVVEMFARYSPLSGRWANFFAILAGVVALAALAATDLVAAEPRPSQILLAQTDEAATADEASAEAEVIPEEACAGASAEARIEGCTVLLERGDLADDRLASVHAARGYAYVVKRSYNRAILDYDRAIELAPEEPQYYVLRGYGYGLAGEHEKAIADFDKAIELQPDEAGPYADRASAHYAAGNVDAALADYAKAIERHPAAAYAFVGRAALYAAEGKADEALADYAKAIEIEPMQPAVFRERAGYLLRLGRYDDAISDYDATLKFWPQDFGSLQDRAIAETLLGNYKAAIGSLDKAIELAQYNEELYVSRGLIEEQIGQHEKAVADFEKALSLAENDVGALIGRARNLALSGETDKALSDIEKALELAPDRPDAFLARAVVYAESNEVEKALTDAHAALGLAPASPKIAADVAGILTRLDENVSAVALLDPILSANPTYEPALMARAKADANEGDIAAARIGVNAALAIRPSVDGFLLRANLKEGEGNRFGAALDLERVLELNADHQQAKTKLMALHEEASDTIAGKVDDVDAHLQLATARLVLGIKERTDAEEAFTSLTKVIELDPDNAPAYYAMARLKLAFNRKDLAMPDFDKAIELDPGFAAARFERGRQLAFGARYDRSMLDLVEAARLDRSLRAGVKGLLRQLIQVATMTKQMQPQNVDLKVAIGAAQIMLGNAGEAVLELDEALQAKPDDARALVFRAEAHADAGEKALAVADLEAALRIDPSNQMAKGRLQDLRSSGN